MLLQLAPLLNKRFRDLTRDDLEKIKAAFKVEVNLSDELIAAAIGLLEGESLDTVADLVQSPEALSQLLQMLRGGAQALIRPALPPASHSGTITIEGPGWVHSV